ncbi:MAG: hypothetical protein WKF84_17090 [Pyrinomonadaceae bacterium]
MRTALRYLKPTICPRLAVWPIMCAAQEHARRTYFNVNRHFNPTNVCYVDCKFCGFYRTPRQPDAYTHNIDAALSIAGQAGQRRRNRTAHRRRIKYEASLFTTTRICFPASKRLTRSFISKP